MLSAASTRVPAPVACPGALGGCWRQGLRSLAAAAWSAAAVRATAAATAAPPPCAATAQDAPMPGWPNAASMRSRRRAACAATATPFSSSASGSGSESAANGGAESSNTSSSGGSGSDPSRSGSGPLNKRVVASSMDGRLYDYLLAHTRELPVLRALREETAGVHGSQMQVSPEQGQFLALLAEITGARRALEIGVFTGYSSLAVALALPPDGRLVALDRDARTMEVARRYWEAAGVAHKVDARLGPAADTLAALLADPAFGPGSFDFAFIDADKRAYQGYFEACLGLVRRGGLIAVDNVLFYGKVADPEADDKATAALRTFNDAVLADERVSLSIVPVGDGMALCRVR